MPIVVGVYAQSLSLLRLFVTPWTEALQAPLFRGFFRQKYWSGWPFPSPEDLGDPWIEPTSPVSLALAGRFFTTEQIGKPCQLSPFPPNIRNRNEAVVFFLSVSIILYIFVSLWSTIPLLSCYSCFQYFFFCQVLPRRSFWGIHLYSWVLGPRVSGFLPSYLHRTC